MRKNSRPAAQCAVTGMPLPHDVITSMVISNGGWFDHELNDKCYCLHSFGYCRSREWEAGRNVNVIKVDGSAELIMKAYEILHALSSGFVNVHNGFNFDMRSIEAASALVPELENTFEEKRVSNKGVGTFWNLRNRTMIVDSMYTADGASWAGCRSA